MKYFLDTIREIAAAHPDRVCMVSGEQESAITYDQFWELSGRVYAYLKECGIGTEDAVCVYLPRGYMPVVAMYGIWRCGAAVVMLEDNYPKERTEYIKSDSGCRAFIDSKLYEEMMEHQGEAGHRTAGEHDKAFMTYTSGTTGRPKGVIHEYGTLARVARVAESGLGRNPDGHTIDALIAPFSFVAGLLTFVHQFCIGSTVYIVPYSIAKNFSALKEYLIRNRINATSLSPTMIKFFDGFGEHLKVVFTGSEPVNNVYIEGIELDNFYSMSEGGFAVTCFKVDRPYDVTPVGKPILDDTIIKLVDENGNEVPDGEPGEITFPNPYFRGYSGDPELTRKALAGGVYHTGDIAKRLPDGNIVILGRNNDMIKINGNRVEPGEVESVFKRITGLEWAVAKGFTKKGQSFLCLYYIGELADGVKAVREKMLEYLPYYMIPAHIIKLDKVPLNANGKFSRSELMAPEIEEKGRPYEPPVTDTEMRLCDAIAKVLGLGRVGAGDDFYELGGDSLGTMRVVRESGLEGINAADFFKGRTPRGIAALYENSRRDSAEDRQKRLEAALSEPHALSREQIYMFDYQMCSAKSTMYNLYSFFEMGESVTAEKLLEAVKQTLQKHTVFYTKYYFNEECDLVQCYDPDIAPGIYIENVSEAELEAMKKTLVKPFKMIRSPLYRVRIFRTERAVYLFFDVHHSIFDGTSFQLFMRDLYKAYRGELDEGKDGYFLMVRERQDAPGRETYRESREYFESRYDGVDWSVKPRPDMAVDGSDSGTLLEGLRITQKQLDEARAVHKFSNNEFFMAAALMAQSMYNGKDDVMSSWTYNDRSSDKLASMCGLLLRFLPVGLRLGAEHGAVSLIDSVHEQILQGMAHCEYPYCVINNNSFGIEDTMCFLYQDNLKENTADESFIAGAEELENELQAAQTALDVEILKNGDAFFVDLNYNSSIYKRESMRRFASILDSTSMELYEGIVSTATV